MKKEMDDKKNKTPSQVDEKDGKPKCCTRGAFSVLESSEATKVKKRNTSEFRSIQFKTWLYFFIMAVFLLIFLSVAQIAFYAIAYQGIKKSETKRTATKIIEQFAKRESISSFRENVTQISYSTGTNIIVFKVDYEIVEGKIVYNSGISTIAGTSSHADYTGAEAGTTPKVPLQEQEILIDEDKFLKQAISETEFAFVSTVPFDNNQRKFLVYGAVVDDAVEGKVFFQLSTALTLSDMSFNALREQLLIALLICLMISILISWFTSARISKPIKDFSEGAKKLAEGDYSVRFKASGFSEIEDLAETLNYATIEIGKTESLRRDFLANVTHDLKTPLTMVKAYAEMIRDISGEDSKKREAHSQVIIDEADRLTILVNDILDLSKLQSGTNVLEETTFDLSVLTKTVLERFDVYSSRGYVFNQDIEKNCVTIADTVKIEQVLYNLISNAINYTGENKKVKVSVKKETEFIRFSVTDSGKGIAADEIEAVWERYYRTGQTKRTFVGTGLGLSIVKNILTAHDAGYGIDSEVGKGTTFWFRLKNENYIPPLEEEPIKKTRKRKKQF